MRENKANILRCAAHLAFILSLSLQVNLGYAATACASFASGPGVCHSGAASTADVALQTPCCCHEIMSCQGLVKADPIDVAVTSAVKWDPSVTPATVQRVDADEQRHAPLRPNAELDIKTPPLHVLQSTFLI